MANKKMFEDRIEEATLFESEGDIKKALATLSKALEKEPEKDIDSYVSEWIIDLKVKLMTEEKPTKLVKSDNVIIHDGNIGIFTKNPKGVCIVGEMLLPGEVQEFKKEWKEALSTIPDIEIYGG